MRKVEELGISSETHGVVPRRRKIVTQVHQEKGMEMLTQSLRALALNLFDVGAVRDKTHQEAVQRGNERGFLLKLHEKTPEAPLSPVYFNLRTADNPKPGPLTPTIVARIGLELWALAYENCRHPYNYIAGLPNAGDPLAAALIYAHRGAYDIVPQLRLQKEMLPDQRRITRLVGSLVGRGKRVLVVDDLITRADTKLEGIKVLAENEYVVDDVIVLIDRQQGGARQLAEVGVKLHALFTLTQLLELYVAEKRMTDESRCEIIAYSQSSIPVVS